MTYRKKLIEVALPLEAINEASAREKSIRHGHPSTLHLWWARRPLVACRAAVDGALVPGSYVEVCRTWEAGDRLVLELPMPVRRVACHPCSSPTGRSGTLTLSMVSAGMGSHFKRSSKASATWAAVS